MLRRLITHGLVVLSFFTLLVALERTAHAEYTILYFQGRAWGSWSHETVTSSPWKSRTIDFNGNARLDGTETNVTVRNAIASSCGAANSCVIVCHSAGCSRVLKAIDDLRASGNTLPGLFWIDAAGSAAGGTKLAEIATQGFTGFLAKLFGQQEKIDVDITPGAARGTWGYTQDAVPPSAMYHVAGNVDICKGFWIFKICGNHFIDAGVGDGLVGMDSASGASTQGRYWDGCAVTRYPGRYWESHTPCGGEPRDHFGIVGRVISVLGPKVSGIGQDKGLVWGDTTSAPECNDSAGECDKPASNSGTDFSKTPSLTSVAVDVSPFTSSTTGSTAGATCAGKCGGHAATGCWCDGACASRGDCCADYTTARCNVVNAQ